VGKGQDSRVPPLPSTSRKQAADTILCIDHPGAPPRGILTLPCHKRYSWVYSYGSTSLGSRILNHGWHPQTAGFPV